MTNVGKFLTPPKTKTPTFLQGFLSFRLPLSLSLVRMLEVQLHIPADPLYVRQTLFRNNYRYRCCRIAERGRQIIRKSPLLQFSQELIHLIVVAYYSCPLHIHPKIFITPHTTPTAAANPSIPRPITTATTTKTSFSSISDSS